MYMAWRIALTTDSPQVYIIGPSQKQQKEIMWQNGRLKGFGPEEYVEQVMESELRIRINGGFIKVDGSENYEAYRGTEYHAMILDEMKDQDPRFYDAAYPNLRALNGMLICIGTPPDSPDNFYVQLLNDIAKDQDWVHVHGTAWENPYVAGIKDEKAAHKWLANERTKYLERGDKEKWLREYEAELAFGGRARVIPNITRKTHVKPHFHIKQLIENHKGKLEWYVILDPGTTSCFAGLFAAVDPYTSQIFLLDEIYEQDQFKTSTDHIWPMVITKSREFHAKESSWRVFYDDAAAWFGGEVLSRYGVYCQPAGKYSADKELGISMLKDIARGENLLFISDRCENLMWEMENYIRDENGRIPKKNDHLIDCLSGDTLVDTLSGQIPIAELVGKEGFVWTTGERIQRFYDVRQTHEEEDIYRVEFDDGRYVDLTDSHKLLLPNGAYQKVSRLSLGDVIQCATYGSRDYIRNLPAVFRREVLSLWKVFLAAVQRGQGFNPVAPGGMGALQWAYPGGVSYSSQGREPKEQPDREFRATDKLRTHAFAYDTREKGLGQREHGQVSSSSSATVAFFSRGKEVAFRKFQTSLGKDGACRKAMRLLLPNLFSEEECGEAFKVLPPELQDECQEGASYWRPTNTSKTARIKRIRFIGKQPTYCMAVPGRNAFSVNNGIIVHNCLRYLLVSSHYELNEDVEPKPDEPRRYVTLEQDIRNWRRQSDIMYEKDVNIFDEGDGEWW
jgi:hypothetical protein